VLIQLTRAARQFGTTVLVVTHEATVAAYADREIVVRDGLITEGASAPAARPVAR
jgi:putative ABC transport system ATP-binding protein